MIDFLPSSSIWYAPCIEYLIRRRLESNFLGMEEDADTKSKMEAPNRVGDENNNVRLKH